MQLPITLEANSGAGLQEQIFERVVALIRSGRLIAGMQMPATRQLADDLSVSRNTVLMAYERLMSEGFIEMRPPLGTFVSPLGVSAAMSTIQSAGASAAADERLTPPRMPTQFRSEMHAMHSPLADSLAYDFWVGRPDPRLFPAQTWRKLIEHAFDSMQHSEGGYGDAAGLESLRGAIADHVGASRGVACGPGDVIVTNGIQEGLNVVSRLLVTTGTWVGMENPGYLGAANVFTSYGAALAPVEVDEHGAVSGALPAECRLMYVTPAHQYPTGATMTPSRRESWLRWAEQCGGYLIEDDYDSDFYYDGAPMPALKSADASGSVIYLGTFSKSLAAGMRMGYMIVPSQLRSAAVAIKGLMTNGSPWLLQAALAEFLHGGEFAHHLRRLRKIYASRRDMLCSSLSHHFGPCGLLGTQAGMHVLWTTPDSMPAANQVEHAAAAVGVGAYGLESCNAWLHGDLVRARWRRGVLLGYAALSSDEIGVSVSKLAAVLSSSTTAVNR